MRFSIVHGLLNCHHPQKEGTKKYLRTLHDKATLDPMKLFKDGWISILREDQGL